MGSRYQEALAALERSRVEAERAADPLLAAKALLGEFLILYELGDLRSAGAVLARAEQKSATADVDTRALVALNRGLLSDAEGNRNSARAAFERALKLAGDKPKSEVAWSAGLDLLELALTAQDLVWAQQAHAAAQPLFEAGFKQRAHSRLAWGYYSAQLELLRQRPEAAFERLEAIAREEGNQSWNWRIEFERGRALLALGRRQPAVAAFERSMAHVEGLRGEQPDQHRSWVLAGRRAPFIALFELHARQGAVGQALEVLERTQGRMFLEAFSAQTAGLTGDGHTFAPAARRVEALKKLYPALRSSALIAAAPLPWSELRRQVRGDHIVAFFEGTDRLYTVSSRRGHVQIHPIDRPLDDVRKLIGQFLERPGEVALADDLGALLFPPAALPPPGQRLLVAPTSLLGRVPFAALRVSGQYLTQRSVVIQIPSLNALVALRGLPPEPASAPLVLANPRGDLPAAESEALVVAAQLGPAARVLLGPQATSTQLRQPARASLLHLALHSGVDADGPWLGLSDRRVAAGEILDWRVRADLVVLSSCASAATPDPGLWGSLAASFLAAGSRAVVGALWSTKDLVNRRFVEDFYASGGARDSRGRAGPHPEGMDCNAGARRPSGPVLLSSAPAQWKKAASGRCPIAAP